MFVDLTKSEMNSKITINEGLTDGETLVFSKVAKTFTFKDSPTEETDVAIAMKTPTYASGFIESFNHYDLKDNDYIDIGDLYGLSFSKYGAFGVLYLKENASINDYVQLSIGGYTYKFIIGIGESTSNIIYINRGNTKSETAYFLSQAINNYMSYFGIFAINYDSTILIRKFTSGEYKANKNAFCKVTFNNYASASDSFSFTTNGVNHTYRFGTGLGFIKAGTSPLDSAEYLAEAINEDSTKPATAVNVNNVVYLYSTVFGVDGNVPTYCSTSGRFSATDFTGGSDSELEITFNSSVVFGTKKVASCISGDYVQSIANADASIHSLSNDIVTTFDFVHSKSNIEYRIAGQNLPMVAFGGTITTNGITGAISATVDVVRTAENLCSKINEYSSLGMTATQKDNDVSVVFSYAETITSSNKLKVDFVNYSSGTLEDPMSWNELLVYKETLGVDNNLANLEITFIKGSLNNITSSEAIVFDEHRNTRVTIATLDEPITYGNNYPFVLNNCDKANVSISGKFLNRCSSLGEVGLVKMSNCTASTCEVINCEDSHLDMQSFLVNLENCSMESFLLIKNSTITQGDTGVNGSLFAVSGYVSVKSQYNVFEGRQRNVNNVVYLGSRCSYESSYDCFSKITPTNSSSFSSTNSKGIYTSELDCDADLVIDKNGTNPWSLNLTPNSRALLISTDKTQPNDINGNKRYLEKDLCKIVITVSDEVIGNGKFVDSNYIEIDGVKKFFGYDMPSSYSSKGEFARAIRNAFISSKYKLGISVSSSVVISLYGTNTTFNSNLGSYITVNYEYEGNGVDGGSRQKHTIINKKYNVDLSANERTDTHITLDDMEKIVTASFPCYGEMTFNLENSNDSSDTIELGYDQNGNAGEGYCNFKFLGTKSGKIFVPTLKADLNFASSKFLTFYFDGIIHIGSVNELQNSSKETTYIDVIFVNSILKWDSSNTLVTLRLLESTIVEKTSGATVTVSKEFIVSGCIIKCKLINNEANIKAVARYNYIIEGYSMTLSSTTKDTEGSFVDVDCLVNSSGSSLDDFAIVSDSKALSYISGTSSLSDEYASITDIVGNYRCSENVKENLDCGAYESNIVFENSLSISVNLDSDATGNGGKYAPCSLQEAYDKINELEKIDIPIYIDISGYGSDIPKFVIDKKFSDSGSINFIGEPNTVLDGGLEDIAFEINSENATISFSNVILRDCHFSINCRKLVFSSCALVNTKEDTLIDGSGSCYFYGCSIQTKTDKICSAESFVLGCSAQSETNISLFTNINTSSGNVCYNCSIQNATVLNSELMEDAISSGVLTSNLFKLTNPSAVGLVSVSDFGDLYEDAESYNYNEDIRGFYRFDENEHTDSGCFDSLGSNDASSYSDKPNGQFAVITEEGSSLITRMLTGKLRFKIVGYSVGRGGYSKRNPVNSIPCTTNGENAKYEITLSSNSLTNDDGIVIGNTEFRISDDIPRESTIEATIESMVKYINKNNGSFYAEKVSRYSFSMTSMTKGSSKNNMIQAIGSNIQVVQNVTGVDSNYGIDICYPANGYKEFEFVDHIPFAISLFLRIDRKEVQSALGEVIVYAKIIKSEIPTEEDTTIPFAVVRHGILTKDKDSVITRRIVIQV